MTSSFPVSSKKRLRELQDFIKQKDLKSVRFNHNPLLTGIERYYVSLTLDVDDCNVLNELQNKWHAEDNTHVKPKKLWQRIKDLIT